MLSTNLLVAADGANSLVRRTVGTFPMTTRSYGRKAVTCTVELESSMAHTAFQRFLPHGPIALLPVWNSQDDNNNKSNVDGSSGKEQPIYANVVWSTTPSEANYLLSLTPSEFTTVLNNHLCHGPNVNPSLLPNDAPSIPFVSTIAKEVDSLLRTANTALTMGTWTEAPTRNYFRMPPKSIGVVGPILGFDLTMSHVVSPGYGGKESYGGYTSPRVALVGDAAHTMHPMAGQGLNLGMDDVNSLSKLIKEAIDSGMDVGGTSLFLDRYNDERMLKGWGIVGGVHGLHEIFGYLFVVSGGYTHQISTNLMNRYRINNFVYAKNQYRHVKEHPRFAILPYSQLVHCPTTTPTTGSSYFIGSKNPPTYQIRQFFSTAVTGLILVARSQAVVHINGKKQLYKMVYWS